MNKWVKRILIGFGILFLVSKGLEWWVEFRFQSIINRKPDRAYDITYEDFDLHTFFKGVTLEEVSIVPVAIDSGSVIRGTVDYARLDGMVWYELLFARHLDIEGILFYRPTFKVTLSSDEKKKTSGTGMQTLFGDILSRARLTRFEIDDGSVILMEPNDEKIRGRLTNLNLKANEIETDSVILNHMIPFQLGSFEASIDSMSFELNEYTHLSAGRMAYVKEQSTLSLNDLQMIYTEDWKEVSRKVGKQTDLIEVSLKELTFDQLEAKSSFYSDLDIETKKIVIRGLVFKDFRDKNMDRPPDTAKPMFKGMVDAIPITLRVDTILLDDAQVVYTELGKGKSEGGTLGFEQINGTITRLTTLPEEQSRYKSFEAKLIARLNGMADIEFDLTVPYDREAFNLTANIGPMDLTRLNETLRPMAGIEIVSGDVDRIHFGMRASEHTSQNKMEFEYENLKVEVLKETEDHEFKNHGLFSAIANSALRNHNKLDYGKYLTADYVSTRNPYRSPFNFMTHSLADGMMHIVPGTIVQKIIGVDKEARKEEKKRKRERKHQKGGAN